MTLKRIAKDRFIGLSTDTKPTGVSPGATFFEYDYQRLFVSPDGDIWTLKAASEYPVAVTTIDLNQAAGDYDLFDAPAATDITIMTLAIIIPADLTGAAAGSLTSISIQSTDTTPVVFISSTAGAKAKLTAGAHLIYNGGDVVESGKKIQLSIAGGATSAAQVCRVYITYVGVV
jgi:hypothetical protein